MQFITSKHTYRFQDPSNIMFINDICDEVL